MHPRFLRTSRALHLATRREALAALGAAVPFGIPAIVRAQSRTIRLGTGTSESFLAPFFARELGLFTRAGLDVDIQALPVLSTALPAIAGGSLDITASDPTQIANAIGRGIAFRIFAGGALYDANHPTIVLCAAPGGSVKSARDLNGQSIGVVSLDGLPTVSVKEWLRQNGGDPATVKFVEMSFATVPAALARGTIAAGVVGEPFLSGAKNDVRWLAQTFTSIGRSFYFNCWFAKKDWLDANPEVARKFAGVLYEAGRWANAHHDESAAIVSTITKIPADRVHGMARSLFPGSLETKLVQPVLDAGVRWGAMAQPVQASEIIWHSTS
jgi:NitT/TauT family transport system substrate-binding protein